MNPGCPSIDVLESFAQHHDPANRSPTVSQAWLVTHVQSCPGCAAQLAQLSSDNALLLDAASVLKTQQGLQTPFNAASPYRLVRELGRGGQGVVYLATHEPTRRQVAVKLLGAASAVSGPLATSRERLRFEREVELAAALRHPAIVTLHDSGVTEDGRPYLVMEFVDGRALDEFARSIRSRTPDRAANTLLRLFVQICRGVGYAHSRGVIHRDLKPANILVCSSDDLAAGDAAPEPRILDFGLAKALHSDSAADRAPTVVGEFAGTLAYAAPEVLTSGAEAADTRSDIYALGVMLYELLTGCRPHERSGSQGLSVAEMIHRQTQATPPPPSAITPEVDRDLDTIVMRAISVDPERRYPTVESLAVDVERRLVGEPIEARRDSILYGLRSRARRHRVTLTLAAAASMILAVLSGTLIVLYRDARASRLLAEAQSKESERQTARAERLLSISLGALSGRTEAGERRSSIADIGQEAADRAERELADDPRARARLFRSLAEMQRRAGNAEAALDYSARVLRDTEAAEGLRSEASFDAMIFRAFVLRTCGNFDDARSVAERACSLARELDGPGSPREAFALTRLGESIREDPAAAMEHFARACDIWAGYPEAAPLERGRSLDGLGLSMLRLGRAPDAEPVIRQSLEIGASIRGALHPRLFPTRELLARSLLEQRRLAEAESVLRELYTGRSANRGGRQTFVVVNTRRMLAEVLVAQGRIDDALALWNDSPGRPSPDAAATIASALLNGPEGVSAAEAVLKRAIGDVTDQTLVSGDGVELAISLLAVCQARRGDFSQARALAEHALRQLTAERNGRRGSGPITTMRRNQVLAHLVEICERTGDQGAAERYRAQIPARTTSFRGEELDVVDPAVDP